MNRALSDYWKSLEYVINLGTYDNQP